MKSPSPTAKPAARKAAPTKTTARKAPAKKPAPLSEGEQIAALLAQAKSPEEKREILGFVEMLNLKLDEISALQNQIINLMDQRLLTAKLHRGLLTMAKATGINLRSEEAQG